MPRKSEIQAEETAVNSPLRRSTRKASVNSPAPAALATRRTSQTHNETAPRTRRASLSQDNSDKDEKVDHKPATRGRRASTTKEEPEPKPEPAKTRGRRSSASVEPTVEEPKPQVTTRRRRSSAAEDLAEPETVNPVRSRRSSATEKPREEEPPKKITRARRGSAKDEEHKEEPVKRATRSRKGSVESADNTEPKEKKPNTRGRRKSTEEVETEPEPKSIKLTPVKSRRIHSVTDNAVILEPIEEIESEIKSRSSSSPITKDIVSTPFKAGKPVELKENLDLSVINENIIVEEPENDKDKSETGTVTPRKSPRINKLKLTSSKSHSTMEKSSEPEVKDSHSTMEKSSEPEVKDSHKEENTEKVPQPSPKKLNFADTEETPLEKDKADEVLAEQIEDEVFPEKVETNTAENEETEKNEEDMLSEEKLEKNLKKTLTETETCNISMGSDGPLRLHINVSVCTQNESIQETDDLNSSKSSNTSSQEIYDLSTSKSSNTSDKENINENTVSSPKKSTAEEKEQVVSSLTNTPVKEKILVQEEIVVARVSNVFRPRMKENSFMEPMDVDEYPPALELEQGEPADSSILTTSTLSAEESHKEIEMKEELAYKNLRKESLIDAENDSVGDSFYLNLTNGAEENEGESKDGSSNQDETSKIKTPEKKTENDSFYLNLTIGAEENEGKSKDESSTQDESSKIKTPEKEKETEHKQETLGETKTTPECKTLIVQLVVEESVDKDVSLEKTEEPNPLTKNSDLPHSPDPKKEEQSNTENENLEVHHGKIRTRSPSYINVDFEDKEKASRRLRSPQPRKSKSPLPNLRRSKSPQVVKEKISRKSKSPQPQSSPKDKSTLEEETSRRSKSPQSRKSKSPQPNLRRSKSPQVVKEKISRKSKSPQPQSSPKDKSTLEEETSRRSKSPQSRKSKSPQPNLRRSKSPQLTKEKISRKSNSPQPNLRRSKSPQLTKEKLSRKSKSPQPQSSSENKLILEEEETSRRLTSPQPRTSNSPQRQNSPKTSRRSKSLQSSEIQKPEQNIERSTSPSRVEDTPTDVTSLLDTENELDEDSYSVEQSTEKSQSQEVSEEKEVNTTAPPEEKLDEQSEVTTVTSQENLKKQSESQEVFSTTESPSSQNLKISDIEVQIRRSMSPPSVRSPQTEDMPRQKLESDEVPSEKINSVSEEKGNTESTEKETDELNSETYKALETESKQSVDAAENTENVPLKDSEKSETLDDYDFALPSDEEEAERTHAPEYDESTVVASYIATSVSTSLEMETVVLVNKTVDESEVLEKVNSLKEKSSDSSLQEDNEELKVDTLQSDPKEKKLDKVDEEEEISESNQILEDNIEKGVDDDKGSEDSNKLRDEFEGEVQKPANEEQDEFVNYDEEKINNSDMKSPQKKLKVRKCYLKKKMESYEEDFEKMDSEEDSEDDLPSPKRMKKPRKRCRVVEKDIEKDDTIGEEDLEETPDVKSPEKRSKSKKLIWKKESDDNTEKVSKRKKDRKSKGITTEEVEDIEETESNEKKSAKKKKKTIPPAKYSTSEDDFDLEKNTQNYDKSADVEEDSERKSKEKKRKSHSPSKTTKDVQVSSKKSPASILNEFTDKVAEELSNEESSEEENPEEPNDYICTMAEEGEEDTPSEDSNAIIDEGELIGSTDSEYGSDSDDYENDSFICDEEDEQLLSGEEYDLSTEKTKKKSRIVQLDNYDDDIIKIQKKEKTKPVEKKRSRIITLTDSSESEENEAEPKDKDSEEVIITLEESSQTEEVVCEEEKIDDEVFIVETKPIATSQEESPNVIIAESPASQQRTEKRRLSSITIQENIDVKEIRDAPLSGRIVNLVDSFCTSMRKGEISMNLSIECCAKDDDSGEETERKIAKKRRLSKSTSSVEIRKNDATLEDESPDEEVSHKPPKQLSVSMDHGSATEARKRRRLSRSMDHLDQIGRKSKKKKIYRKTAAKKAKTSPRRLADQVNIQSLGLLNQLITDIKNRPRRSVKPSTNMNNSWFTEVAHLKPSTTSFDKEEKAAYKAGKVHPKDFRSQMLNDPSRVRRIETKALLKKKGVHL